MDKQELIDSLAEIELKTKALATQVDQVQSEIDGHVRASEELDQAVADLEGKFSDAQAEGLDQALAALEGEEVQGAP